MIDLIQKFIDYNIMGVVYSETFFWHPDSMDTKDGNTLANEALETILELYSLYTVHQYAKNKSPWVFQEMGDSKRFKVKHLRRDVQSYILRIKVDVIKGLGETTVVRTSVEYQEDFKHKVLVTSRGYAVPFSEVRSLISREIRNKRAELMDESKPASEKAHAKYLIDRSEYLKTYGTLEHEVAKVKFMQDEQDYKEAIRKHIEDSRNKAL